MKHGIFAANNAATAEHDSEFTIEQEIVADAAYDAAVSLAFAASVDAASIDQAISVAAELDVQSEAIDMLCTGEHNHLITAGTVAVAQDALALAVVALGGSGKTGYEVTGEAAASSPVEAMEVTGEGVKDTMKKIYAGIKMLFQRIALTLKKLAAKVVVALNGTGKKAEKLLKSFKADKSLVAKESKVDSVKALKILETLPMHGLNGWTLEVGVTNMRAMSTHMITMVDAITEAQQEAKTKFEVELTDLRDTQRASPGSKKQRKARSKRIFAKQAKLAKLLKDIGDGGKPSFTLDGGVKPITLSSEQLGEVGLDDAASDVTAYPLYYKNNYLYSVAFYVEEISDDDKDDPIRLASKAKYKVIKLQAISDDELTAKSDNDPVMTRSVIEAALSALKPASKQLKTYSDARMKDIDKVMTAIDKLAKTTTGLTMFNKLANNELNKTRMFAASVYVASVFAMVTVTRATLSAVQVNIAMYTEA